MNTDNLAKHYARLLPDERHLLILAANVRGDATEVDRLERTAPRVKYSVPHHYPHAEALEFVLLEFLSKFLSLSSAYWQAHSWLVDAAAQRDKEAQACLRQHRAVLGNLLCTYFRGWQQFCQTVKVPAEVLKRFVAEWDLVDFTLQSAQAAACSATELAELAAGLGPQTNGDTATPPRAITVADVAESLERRWKMRTATWQ
jgi:hypothetical protein